MPNKFQLKRTTVTGRTANTTNNANNAFLDKGELAVNLADRKVFSSDVANNLFEVGSNLTNLSITSSVTLDNDVQLRFKTLNGNTVGFRQQSDDNFVFYTTNTTGGDRAVFAIYANTVSSNLSILAPTVFNTNVYIGALSANGSLGTDGQVLTSNGSTVFWQSLAAIGTNVNATFVWTNNHTFNATVVANNISGNGAGLTSVNALTVGGNTASTLRTYTDDRAANAYSNAVTYIDTKIGTANTAMAANAAAAYTNATIFAANASNANNGTLAEARLPFRMDQNLRTTDSPTFANGSFTGSLSVGGNLTITGNLISTNIESFSVKDPLIKLGVNNASDVLWGGFTFHYSGSGNTTNHAGLVRSPTSKEFILMSTFGDETSVFDNNTINIADATFSYANLTVNLLKTGNATVFSTINTTSFSGTANNSTNFGGLSLATVQGQITGNAATAYTNSVSYTDTKIGTANTAITGNAATAYTNAVAYTDTRIGTANTAITGNAATAYTNAITIAANATNLTSGTVAFARLPSLFLGTTAIQSTSAAQAVSGITTLAAGNTTITGFANVSGNLTATNPIFNNIKHGYSTTVTAAGTTVLTSSSNYMQFFTGTTTQILSLPAPQTMTLGQGFLIVNNSTGNIEVRAANAAGIINVLPGTVALCTSIDLTAGNGALGWNAEFVGFSNATGTGSVVLSASPTLSGTVTLGSAGLSSNGGLGTAGHVLHSNGSATYWAADDGITSLVAANGLNGGTITSTGTISVLGGSTLTVNSVGAHVNSALSITSLTLAGSANGITTLAAGNTTITGFANVSTTLQVGTNTATFGTAAYIVANGNVGIGTSTPAATLTVGGVAGGDRTFQLGSAGATRGVLSTDGTNGIFSIGATNDSTTGILTFKTGSALVEGMRIDASGNVGIGNISPAHRLSVGGTFAVSGISTFSGNVVLGSVGVSANGGFGTAGQVLHSNGTATYWAADDNSGTVTSVATGNGLTGGPITTTGTVSVLANTGIVANATGLFVNSAYIAAISANNASYLQTKTWEAPGTIGSTTANSGAFTSITASGSISQPTTSTTSVAGLHLGYNVEGSWADHPFLLNDLGNLRLRGGTFTANTTHSLADSQKDALFDGQPTYCTIDSTTATFPMVLEFTLPQTLFWGSWVGISFGTSAFRANTLKIEAFSQGAWVTCFDTTSFTGEQVVVPITGNAGVGTTALRFTFANPQTVSSSGFRINNIWAFHYASAGWSNLAMPRAGGQFYGNVSVNSTSTVVVGGNTLNATTWSGSANNTTYLNGQLAAYYTNATNITTGTLPYAQIPANVINTTAAFTRTGITTFSANVVLGTSGVSANGGFGTAGHVLHSNGTATYWDADDQGVTSVATANGLSGGTITSTGTLGVTTGNTLTVNAAGIHVNSALSIASLALSGDLTVSGNVTVSGTRTYVNTTTLDVGDNIITLNADLGANPPTENAGIEIMRGTSANVQFVWDETNDRWTTNGQPMAVSSLVAAGAASGITTLAAGNTTITGFANVTSTIQGGSSLTIAGAASGITTLAAGNTTITGFANVSTTLQVGGVATFAANANFDSGLLFVDGVNNRVGISNTNPAATLHLQGNALIGGDGANNYDFKLQRLSSGVRAVQHDFAATTNSPWILHGESLSWTGERSGTVESTQAFRPYYEAFAPVVGYKEFGFVNVTSGSFTGTNLIPNLVLASNGNVGLGNTSPTDRLSVNGTIAAGNTTITGFANASVSVNSALLTVGTSFIANTLGAYHTGTVNAASHTVGTAFIANATGVTTTGFANVGTTLQVAGVATFAANANFDSGVLFVDGVNNRVGVGTLTPGVKFDVVGTDGDGLQYRTSTRTIGIGSVGGVNALYGGSGTELTFHIASERMRISNTGNISVGQTTTPARFTSQTSAFGDATAANSNVPFYGKNDGGTSTATRNLFLGHTYTANATTRADMQLLLVNSNDSSAISGSMVYTNDGALAFRNGGVSVAADTLTGTERMRIDSSGNIGIGTAAPASLVHIARTLANNDWNAITLANKGSWSTATGKGALINVTDSDTVTNTVGKFGITFDAATYGAFVVRNLYNGSYGASGDVLYARGDGNVGIGTSIPTTRLHVSQSNSGDYASVILLSNAADAAADRTGIYGSAAPGNANAYRGGITFHPGATGAVSIHTGNNSTPSAGERMRIDSNGQVGINMTPVTTAGRLQINQSLGSSVDGALRLTDNATTSLVFNNISNGLSALWSSGALAFGTANNTFTERMRINTAGNLLVGTSTSYTRLTVSNGTGTRSGITISDTSSSSLMMFAGNSSPSVISTDAYDLVFRRGATAGTDNGTETMRILNASGDVGIGNTSPAHRLSVGGTVAAGNTTITGFANVSVSVNSALLTVGTSFIANTTVTTITDTTGLASSTQPLAVKNGSYVLGVVPRSGSGAYNNLVTLDDTTIVITGASIGNANLAIVPWSGASGGFRMATVANSTTIGITGNTTITGFANVTSTLQVGGIATFAANANFDSGVLFVDATNNRVGVNTTTPGVQLDVVGAGRVSQSFTIGSGGNYEAGSIYSDANWGMIFRAKQASPTQAEFTWHNSADSALMRLVANGNLGIGTTTPGSKLAVAGTLAAGNTTITGFANVTSTLQVGGVATFAANANFDSGALFVDGTNNRVGVNNTTPQYALDVNAGSSTNIQASFGASIASGVWTGIHFGYTEAANQSYRKSALVFERQDSAARGKIHILNNAQNGSDSASLTDSRVTIQYDGNVGIGTTTPGYKLEVNGSFAATTKSFLIDHPTKPDMKLRYGSLEGPENGVYVRGRLRAGETTIQLPDYWSGLVDEDTYTVNLTPVGNHQQLFVRYIADDYIVVGSEEGKDIDCFYTVFAERKDVDKLVVEF